MAELREIEAKNDYSNPRYMELLMPNFYNKFICRLPVWPEPLTRSLKSLNEAFYTIMQGPSEFGLIGKLSNWERGKDLGKITVPTLTIGAKYDTMDPKHMKWMSEQVKNGTFLFCPNGSHMCFYDDQQAYFKGLTNYILSLDNNKQ